ncbi:uncharacterized protein LOC112504578 [Cynara cardunculus var. scolymus]|uniref:uncharacterized protein LOC112504578 n=1 Tax=Cynara cardunculus var. scolymus TaxID=59895 RepID=UPI000D62C58D|nr:uncharacterized protein LOC112504578 [Cynara cardunculus var. scolymus]
MPTVLENPPPTNVTSMSDHHPNRKSLKLPFVDAPPLDYQSFDSIQLGDEVASFNMYHDFGSINPNQFDDFGITRIAHNFIPEIGRGSPSTLKIDNYFEDISDSTLDSCANSSMPLSTIEQASSMVRLSAGHHRLQTRNVNVADIPIIDITSDEEPDHPVTATNIIARIFEEIRRFVKDTCLNPEDRPNILCRLFKIKLDALVRELKENEFFFGKIQADFKLPTVEQIYPIISAKIPDKNSDPDLRVDERFIEKSGVKLDNRNVVPYNKHLLKRYQAHINVEWCNQASSIKYMFKYINKGPDRAIVAIVENNNDVVTVNVVDEIKQYYDCRYLFSCEASCRIFGYDVHYRTPSVLRLPFHLPGQQQVVFGAKDNIHNVLNRPSVASSMFLAWMHCNQIYQEAQELTYVEFPIKYVWKLDERPWDRRKKGFSIRRIHSVSPTVGEGYYLRILLNKVKGPKSFEDILRILLNKVKGPKSFEDIRTVNGKTFLTFRDACYTLGLLDDDKEYIEAIEEANLTASDLSLNEEQVKNLTLFEIEKILLRNNSTLKDFTTLPYPDNDSLESSNNRLIAEEMDYNHHNLRDEFQTLVNALTNEQRGVYNEIMTAIEKKKGGVFFEYGGIASLLLTGGRIAHSRFHILLILNEDSLCHMKPDSDVASLIKKTTLIIRDEAPMVHKHAFEELNRSMNDISNAQRSGDSHMLFGGKVIVFGGDFRQILPVILNAGGQDIVNPSLSSSYIWEKCKVLRLTRNMRLTANSESSEIEQTRDFAKWILDLGEGKVGGDNDGEAIIEILYDLLITDCIDPISALIEFVYPSILENINNSAYFQERAILAPKNEVVQEINDCLLSLFPGEENQYLSLDTLCELEHIHDEFDKTLYSPDVLNSLKLSGIPNHKILLKVGVPIMLLRNIDQKSGLSNGTRLRVLTLGNRVIEAQVISGSNIGSRAFIPRISLSPTNKKTPFKFQRRQFPIDVCFAMTINKSQGQSSSKVGLFLRQPVFTHGQLYVVLSRVKSKQGLKVLIMDDDDGIIDSKTTNVVYKEMFINI